MTTIVATRKCMAADSRVSGDGVIYNTTKVMRIGDNLVGVAGTVSATTRFLSWFGKGCPADGVTFSDDDDFSGLVLNAKGLFYYAECCDPDKICNPFAAIGSGAQAALAAMHCDKTPEEAVRIAMKCDINTGGPVRVYNLKGE